MANIPYICRITTTWSKTGEFDEDAYRRFLQRLIDSDIDIFMASSATEGRTLSFDELLRVYQVGVEHCKGKVVIGASGCEENTAAATILRAKVAVEAGVDVVNIYGPAGWHGYHPTRDEYLAFFDNVFKEIHHSVAVCPNENLGYRPAPDWLAEVCNKHSQVVAAVLTGIYDEMYFIQLKDLLRRPLDIYVRPFGAFSLLAVGASGVAGNGAMVLPKTCRQYLDLYQAKQYEASSKAYYDIRRFERFCSRWNDQQIARSVKMALKAFRLPGGEGGMREPDIMPDDHEVEQFIDGALKLNIPEIDEMARAAGLVPTDSPAT